MKGYLGLTARTVLAEECTKVLLAQGRKAWRNSRRGKTISPGTRTKQLFWPFLLSEQKEHLLQNQAPPAHSALHQHLSARKCVSAVTAPLSSSPLSGMGELRRKSEVLYKKLNYLALWVVRRWKGTWMFKIVKKNSSLLCTEEAEESEYVTAGQCVLQPAGITKDPGKWEYCQAETPKSLNLYQKALTSFTTDSNDNNICFLKGKKMRNICPWTSEAGVMHHFRQKRMKNLMGKVI